MPPSLPDESFEPHSRGQAAERFSFGENWSSFVDLLSPARIAEAEKSLRTMLDVETLSGKSFLDIGSGSGLFSLAARRLDAARILSFDFDPMSVQTTMRLRDRHSPGDARWEVERGDVLDAGYMSELGRFDVVYAWGVVPHTGDMATALRYTAERVATGGRLFVSVYHDQGFRSRIWRVVKRTYNRIPAWLRPVYVVLAMAPIELRHALGELRAGAPRRYLEHWRSYETSRGMDRWHDLVDWVGGYPFEVARPEEIIQFYRRRGFALSKLALTRSLGNNQYVFTRPD